MITYLARETVDQVVGEIGPLLVEHWREIAQYPDIPLHVGFDEYRCAEAQGRLFIFTVRRDFPTQAGVLIGYAVYQVDRPLHYRTSLQARQDVLFVLKEHRRGRLGYRLIEFADEALRREGVQVVYQHMKVAHDFGPLLQRLGYELAEHIYSRRLR